MNFEEIFTINIEIEQPIELNCDNGDTVIMIPFTGSTSGKYFNGRVLPGGVDTQIIGKHGDKHTISARYMLEGKDYTGETCKIYIENNGKSVKKVKNRLFKTYPKIITDSKALIFLNQDILVGEVIMTDKGVDVKIYRAL